MGRTVFEQYIQEDVINNLHVIICKCKLFLSLCNIFDCCTKKKVFYKSKYCVLRKKGTLYVFELKKDFWYDEWVCVGVYVWSGTRRKGVRAGNG